MIQTRPVDAGPAMDRPVSDRPVSDRPVSDRPVSDRPVSARPLVDLVAAAVLLATPLAVVVLPLLRAGADARAALAPALFLAGAAVATAAAVTGLPALAVPALTGRRRGAVLPAMLVGAGVGSIAVLVAPAVADAIPAGSRLHPSAALLPYVAAAAAAFGLAQILALHRYARVGSRGVVLIAVAALAVGAAEALLPASPTLDDGVVGLMAAAAVLLVGLGTATLAGGPARSTAAGRVTTDGRAEAVEPATVALALGAVVVGLVARALVGSTGGAGDAAILPLVGGSFHDALRSAAAGSHPPLSMALVWLSRHTFGPSALALRLPSLLAGLALVPAAYACGRRLYGPRTGLVAAAVAGIGPAFVWISADTGPAALTALLVCLSLLALATALDGGGPGIWLLFGLADAAVVWTHQFGLATVAVLHVAAGVALARRYRTGSRPATALAGWAGALVMTVAAAGALVAWHHGLGTGVTPAPLEYATNAAPSGGHTPFGLAAGALSTVVGFHPPDVTSRLLALWPLSILAAFALFGRRWSAKGFLLLGLAAVPFAALLVADLAGSPRQPPLALAWLAPALPAVALAAGRAVDRLTARQGRFPLVVAALVALLVLGTADQGVRVADHRPVPPPVADPAHTPGR